MSRNTPAEFKLPKSSAEYEIYMWDKFEARWFSYQNIDRFESARACEDEIVKYNSQLPIGFSPREHWKIVRVSKIYEVVEPTGGAQ